MILIYCTLLRSDVIRNRFSVSCLRWRILRDVMEVKRNIRLMLANQLCKELCEKGIQALRKTLQIV